MSRRFHRTLRRLCGLVVALASGFVAIAQAADRGALLRGTRTPAEGIPLNEDDVVTALVTPDGAAAAPAIAPANGSGPLRWIVRLRDTGTPGSNGSPRARAKEATDRFVADLTTSVPNDVEIRRVLTNLSATVVVDASEHAAESLRRRPDVEIVVRDGRIAACSGEPADVIHADAYWRGLGISGAGVTVAIVDSGIDYSHPDLGGGFGPAFEVRGGFDFVNDDADPMDDFGHGTHVAGIIAGNGDVRGIAWGARLLAYKVLDRRGQGRTSDVLAALDRLADPDGDPRTNDAPEVVNLSLGGPASADDPLLPAIHELRVRGICCVVAAGNDGPDYGTITSPGTSDDAITVGATDSNDAVAAFSSRGPTRSHAIKPDLVAPGIDVRSTWLGGGTRTLSGTSMATAVASGAAALVCAAHPGIPPQAVAAILATSATPIGDTRSVWPAGSGRVDLARSLRLALLTSTASLSFGVDDPAPPSLHATRRIAVTGVGDSRVVRASIDGSVPDGAQITIDPVEFTLARGGTGEITITLEVDEARVADVALEPFSYDAAIVFSAEGSIDARVPFEWFKAPELTIAFDEAPWTLLFHDRAGHATLAAEPGRRMSVLVPRGTYDLLALFHDGSTFSAVEGVAIDRAVTVDIRKSSASHLVSLRPVDENAHALSPSLLGLEIRHVPTGVAQVLLGNVPPRFAFSGLGADYRIGWTSQTRVGNALFEVTGARRGVSADTVLANDPAQLHRSTLRVAPPAEDGPVNGTVHVTSWLSYVQPATFWSFALFRNDVDSDSPYETELVVSAPPADDFPFAVQCWLGRPGSAPFRVTPFYDGGGSGLRGFLWGATSPALDGVTGVVRTGLGPPRFHAGLRNTRTRLRVDAIDGRLNYFFLDALGDFTPASGLGYELRQDGQLVASGSFASAGGDGTGRSLEEIPVAAGAYDLRVAYDRYSIAGERGHAVATWRVDTRRVSADGSGDADPPDITRFAVLDGSGQPADEIDPVQGGEVRLALRDASALGTVALFSEVEGVESPIPLEVDPSGDRRASLAVLPSGRRVGLRLVAADDSGNSLDLLLDPALRTRQQGGAPPLIDSVMPLTASLAEGLEVALSGHGFASAGAIRVTLDGRAASDVRVQDDAHVSFRTPVVEQQGPVDLVVSNDVGEARLERGFLYVEIAGNAACRLGNVDAANGSPVPVLGVDAGVGDGLTIRLARGESFSLIVSPPPAGPEPAGFALYAMPALPSAATVAVQPFGIGTACLPTPLTPSVTAPIRVLANSLGHRTRLGRPMRNSTPAPASISFARGLRGPATLTVQGLIEDLGSSGPGISVTNAVVVWIR
ncbi:MAG: S8 family serine peptidase [Planctomycetes bacterium]|nr:S8 family serine peptidase [Planctomycetota bacterium]MBI3844102.1 S8 family serine peptidase [Planctomycetota bacterium]